MYRIRHGDVAAYILGLVGKRRKAGNLKAAPGRSAMGEALESRVMMSAGPGDASFVPVPDPTVSVARGVLTVTGASGNDSIEITDTGTGFYQVAFNGGTTQYRKTDVTSIVVDAGNGDDVVTISSAITLGTTINGGNGDDSIVGGGGRDSVFGGSGRDIIDGGRGSDYLRGGAGADLLTGRAGNDTLAGGGGADTINGGGGSNTLTYTGLAVGISLTLTDTGGICSDGDLLMSRFDVVIGSGGADRIDAKQRAFSCTLAGEGGDDTLTGGSGNDELRGGDGNDSLLEQWGGTNTLCGGVGDDYFYTFNGQADELRGGRGNDSATIDQVDEANVGHVLGIESVVVGVVEIETSL